MILYKQGDILLVPFPFTDFSTFKQRPVLVVSSGTFNRTQGDVIVVAITSHLASRLNKYEYRIPEQQRLQAGLPKPSIIKYGKIVTIDKRLIRKRLGVLSLQAMENIISKVQDIISHS